MSKIVSSLFASVAFIAIMLKILLKSIHEGSTDPLFVLEMSLLGALVFGLIGFYLGRVFDEGQDAVDNGDIILKEQDDQLLIDDILVYDIGVPTKKDVEKASPKPAAEPTPEQKK